MKNWQESAGMRNVPVTDQGRVAHPHVMSPIRFRTVLAQYQSAFICKFDIPTTVLFGNERNEVLRLLHETVSSIRDVALKIGCAECMALAAGSCKHIFCADHNDCPVISSNGRCRYPRYACPSMSGLGIEVNRIMRIAGWDKTVVGKSSDPVSGMTGMVLLKRNDQNGSEQNRLFCDVVEKNHNNDRENS